jgi:hypothetical protein
LGGFGSVVRISCLAQCGIKGGLNEQVIGRLVGNLVPCTIEWVS